MARTVYLARRVSDQDTAMRYTNGTGSSIAAGNPCKIEVSSSKAIAGVALETIANGATGMMDIGNIYDFPCAAAQTFSEGDQVYYNTEGLNAIPASQANGLDDYCLGTCVKTRAATDPAFVQVRLNFGPSQFVLLGSSSSSSST